MNVSFYCITMSKKKLLSNGWESEVEKLERRVQELETLIRKNFKDNVEEINVPLTVDISKFVEVWSKSALLQALYPVREEDSRIYKLDDYDMTRSCSGYWPSNRNWQGIYLGGCEQTNELRRANTIPVCIKSSIEFFNPQGLTNSSADALVRMEALNSCSSAVIDFTQDEMCLNYTHGMDLIYLLAQGFIKISLIQFPTSPSVSCIKFDNEEKFKNVCGAYDCVSLRTRRFEYYTILRQIVSEIGLINEFPAMDGKDGLAQNMINLRANFLQPHGQGIQLSVIDRLAIYRTLKTKNFESDIAVIIRICFGILLLCDMRTRDFMETHMPDWKQLRGEFHSLCLQMEMEAGNLLSSSTNENTDSDFHVSACIDSINFVKTLVDKTLHLN